MLESIIYLLRCHYFSLCHLAALYINSVLFLLMSANAMKFSNFRATHTHTPGTFYFLRDKLVMTSPIVVNTQVTIVSFRVHCVVFCPCAAYRQGTVEGIEERFRDCGCIVVLFTCVKAALLL